ncbi:primosomal protein N' [Thiohalocapsa marina]|uniref:Replication restart protein PriA n=1 Tax=Thiohalocapsa marina TaxID=424902 RepID=A0A5M8FKX6_9GAMM|nr:primosomal protein N' [Thiohalocapsa marina]KAA6185389.1 primosomal protein N' [Thiohalocapsa marina]
MSTAQTTTACIRVAVTSAPADLFDYLPPVPGGPVVPCAGMRVLVPFGRGRRVGMITSVAATSALPPDRLKRIDALLDRTPLLTDGDLRFVLWAARYYQCSPAEALFSAIPARLRRPEPVLDPAAPGWRATAAGATLAMADLQRAPRQRDALGLLRSQPAGLEDGMLRQRLGDCSAALRALASKGLVARCRIAADAGNGPSASAPNAEHPPPKSAQASDQAPNQDTGPELNTEQQQAVDIIAQQSGFGCFLLDGVTGSGKTEVYLRLIEGALAQGRQVLVLVPEIGLTPQLRERFARRIAAPMAVLHSALGERERELAWQQAASGRARLVLGTRSAIFTPMPALGLLIVDEEHDASLKQQDGFRYSARDLAVRRGQLADSPVVLGSATPSLETLFNAREGRYRRLALTRRAGQAADPDIRLVDIRGQYLETGLSHALLTHMDQQIEAGNQVLLFLNRRGFSPVLTCHDCGWVSECNHCDARMTLHRGRDQLLCHHCGLTQPRPLRCPCCESPDLRPLGQGTERVEDTLRKRFAGVPLARIDRDSTRRKGELERLLAAAQRGDYRILLGTQMLAKGHHLPAITLVGIMDIDFGLYGTDFRAAERMAQLLIQVAGRAGRADRPGTVLVQTRHPQHPMLERLLRQGYGSFAEAALAERAAAALPPFSHQALLRADSPKAQAALEFLRQVLVTARPLAPPSVEFWGPAPAQMERRAGRVRAQLLLQAPRRSQLQGLLATLLPRLRALPAPRHVRWSIDVDPKDLY